MTEPDLSDLERQLEIALIRGRLTGTPELLTDLYTLKTQAPAAYQFTVTWLCGTQTLDRPLDLDRLLGALLLFTGAHTGKGLRGPQFPLWFIARHVATGKK